MHKPQIGINKIGISSQRHFKGGHLAVLTLAFELLLCVPAFCQPAPPAPPPLLLDAWALDQPNWPDIFGDAPSGFSGLNVASGWDSEAGTALSVDTNVSAYLNQVAAVDGSYTNVSLSAGTISVWFQANWTSVADGGSGPTNWASLLTLGQFTTNASASCWWLGIDPNGTNLMFLCQSNGSEQVVLAAPIDFDAGDWHNICLTYSATNCCLYLEGLLVTNGGAISYMPSNADYFDYGVFIGSEGSNGIYQAHGQFQDLETYEGPLTSNEVGWQYASAAAIIANAGGSLPGGGFHPDDEGPPAPPGGTNSGGGGGIPEGSSITFNPGTNLYLLIAQQSNSVVITFSNAVAGLPYVLLQSTDLQTWTTNQSFLATNVLSVAPLPVPLDAASNLYFMGVQEVPGALRWSVDLGGNGDNWGEFFGGGLDSTPAVGGGIVFAVSCGGTTAANVIFAVDIQSGTILWSNSLFNSSFLSFSDLQEPEFTGSATISMGASNAVYVGSDDDNLYSFGFDGSTNWIRNMGDWTAVFSTPALGSNGTIYVTTDETIPASDGSPTTGLLAINPTDGSTNWFLVTQTQFTAEASVDGSPAVAADGTIYFLAEGSRLYAITPGGHLKWFMPIPGDADVDLDSHEPDSSVALGPDGTIYVGSDTSYFYAVNPDGSLRWAFGADPLSVDSQIFQGSPSVGLDGTIYAPLLPNVDGTPVVYAFNPDGSTNVRTVFNEGDISLSCPAVGADGTLYVCECFSGTLNNISTNGSTVWSFTAGGNIVGSPTIGPDGTIFFTCEDKKLYAVWGSTPPATNGWPMFLQNATHGGRQTPATAQAADTEAPFVYNATNSGGTNFSFSVVGISNSMWNVYATTNLSNWVQIYTNLLLPTNLDAFNGNTNFTDTNIAGVAEKFYQLSNSGYASRIIGFVNQPLVAGTNLIANQLCQVDEAIQSNFLSPMNTLNSLFVPYWTTNQNSNAVMNWNGESFDTFTFNFGEFVQHGTWLDTSNEQNGDATLLPGNSVLMTNGAPMTNTFIGMLRQQQIIHIQPRTNSLSTNYLSATFPVAGAITNITGYVPSNGDIIQQWNTNTQSFYSNTFSSGAWTPSNPVVRVGEGFVLITSNIYTWTNTWSP